MENDVGLVNFYVTVGRGLGQLAEEMLKLKLPKFHLNHSMEGKLLFSCNREAEVLQLKGVERIFIRLGFWLFTDPKPTAIEISSFLDSLAEKVPLAFEDWEFYQRDPITTATVESEPEGKRAKWTKTFRVNVKLAGTVGRQLNFSSVSKRFAAELTAKNPHWTVDLKSPTVEISIHLNDVCCIVGLPLTKEPLSNRTYLKRPGLRSTICDAMILQAQITKGQLVVDPMCGVGTLLVEAMVQHPDNMFVGIDISGAAAALSQENLQFATEISAGLHWDLLNGDATRLPLRDSSVDRILTDIPFGQKHKTSQPLNLLLLQLLAEIKRVLKPKTIAVLLCPVVVRSRIQSQLDELNRPCDAGDLRVVNLHSVSLGVTDAVIVVLTKG